VTSDRLASTHRIEIVTSPPTAVQSIVMTMSACLSVCPLA